MPSDPCFWEVEALDKSGWAAFSKVWFDFKSMFCTRILHRLIFMVAACFKLGRHLSSSRSVMCPLRPPMALQLRFFPRPRLRLTLAVFKLVLTVVVEAALRPWLLDLCKARQLMYCWDSGRKNSDPQKLRFRSVNSTASEQSPPANRSTAKFAIGVLGIPPAFGWRVRVPTRSAVLNLMRGFVIWSARLPNGV